MGVHEIDICLKEQYFLEKTMKNSLHFKKYDIIFLLIYCKEGVV